jgi:hypothetical protein
MPSFFAAIRFVPSAITNESINVGVLLVSGDRVEVRTLDDWQRVKAFAGPSWRDVRRLIADMADNPGRFLGIDSVQSADQLRERLSAWTRVIQFSDVRASLASMNELSATIPTMILGESAERLPASGRRGVVLRALYQAAVSAYELRFERRPHGIIRKQAIVPGKKAHHKIDVGIVNGQFYAGAFALSFATPQAERQWKDTDAVAFAIEDTTVPRDAIAVVLDGPSQQSEPYERARALFERLQVQTLPFEGISEWANRAVTVVPEGATH